MAANSQDKVEAHFNQRWALVRRGVLTTIDAYDAPAEDWIVGLGSHKLLLNPFLRSWLYYNRTHDTWDDTGFGHGEALFVSVGSYAGAKKIPHESHSKGQIPKETPPLADWFVYISDGKLCGPVQEFELKQRLSAGDLAADTLVFNATLTEWQKADSAGLIPPAAPVAKPKVTSKAPRKAPVPTKSKMSTPQPTPSLVCPKCKTEYIDGDMFCANCGLDLRTTISALQNCPGCGTELQPDDAFCPNCGKKVEGETIKQTEERTTPKPSTCPKCGAPLRPDASFCMKCGGKI